MEKQHDSQIQVRFNRINSRGSDQFYGSDILCNSYMELIICKSKYERSHGGDSFFGGKHLLRCKMTNNQFAELITSLNFGSGIPATLEEINQRDLPTFIKQPPFIDKIALIQSELGDDVQECQDDVDKLKKYIDDMKISKKAKFEIGLMIERIESMHKSNIAFYVSQAKKSVDKMVTSAKSNIESYYYTLINKFGVKAMKENSVKLMIKENDNDGDENN